MRHEPIVDGIMTTCLLADSQAGEQNKIRRAEALPTLTVIGIYNQPAFDVSELLGILPFLGDIRILG